MKCECPSLESLSREELYALADKIRKVLDRKDRVRRDRVKARAVKVTKSLKKSKGKS